jgi:hypothetical protein
VNSRIGGRRHTTMQGCIRRKPRDDMTRGSKRNLSNREIRYYSLTLALNFLVVESLEVNGMALSQF